MTPLGRSLASCVVAIGAAGAALADDARLALRGYDPVAYFTLGTATPGDAGHEIVFDHERYRFASAEHMTLFEAEPDAYLPQFSGACAAGVSDGMVVEADPEKWRIVDGRLYVFSEVPDDLDADPYALVAQAEANWPGLADMPF